MTDTTPQTADDPFGPHLPAGGLYIGSTLQQRIDLIEHLVEFGRQIIVLSGPPGSGKSTLLAAIAAAADRRWACASIQGGPALQARPLLTQIADALDVELSADGELRMAQTMLRLRINVLERAGKITVLLVDDADELAPDAVAALVALARSEDQSAEARVLLTADEDHAGLLANLQRDRPQHGLVHVVEIPPLTEAQVGDFIARRMSAAGLHAGEEFGNADIQRIASAAAGNPARIVALARQHFIHKRTAREVGARRPTRRTTSPRATFALATLAGGSARRWAPLLVLSVLLAAGVWWAMREDGDDAPEHASAITLPLPDVAPAQPPSPAADADALTPPAPTDDTAIGTAQDPELAGNDDERDLIEIVLPDEPVDPGTPAMLAPPVTPPMPPAAAPVTPEKPAAPPAPVVMPPPDTAPVPAPVPSPAPPQRDDPPTVARSTPAPAVAVAPTGPPPVRPVSPPPSKPAAAPGTSARVNGFSADWLLKQPRGAYTLQLAGVRDRASAVRFIQRHGLGTEATLLTTRRDGRPWYVLVHGYYPSRQAAITAAARLPASVRKEVEPWARTIGELATLPR